MVMRRSAWSRRWILRPQASPQKGDPTPNLLRTTWRASGRRRSQRHTVAKRGSLLPRDRYTSLLSAPAYFVPLTALPPSLPSLPAVPACRPRPVQCGRCGRLDHVTAGCKGTVRCARCGGGHNSQQCTAGVARCSNCSGRHSVTDPRCPRWQHERRVATSMAQALKPVPRAEVEASVLSAQPSYAEMVRRCSTQQQTRLGPQTPQGRLQPRSPAQRKAARRATAQQPAPPAVPVVALAAPGPEQLMPVLLALTHSLVGRLPADDPARMAATDALALLSPPAHLHHG